MFLYTSVKVIFQFDASQFLYSPHFATYDCSKIILTPKSWAKDEKRPAFVTVLQTIARNFWPDVPDVIPDVPDVIVEI